MKSRFEFGMRELVAGVLLTFAYCLLSMLQFRLYMMGSATFGIYIYLPGILVAVSAAIFGPIVGIICALCGQLVANVYVYGHAGLMDLLVIVIIGVAMGLLADRVQILKGRFNLLAYIDCNVMHLFASIATLVLLRPLYSFLLQGSSLEEGLVAGMQVCAGNTVVMLTAGSLIMWLVSFIMGKSQNLMQRILKGN